jgi:hypothetical protein
LSIKAMHSIRSTKAAPLTMFFSNFFLVISLSCF